MSSIYMSYVCISGGGVEADTRYYVCTRVWRGVGCGGWRGLPVRLGIRMGGIGWKDF